MWEKSGVGWDLEEIGKRERGPRKRVFHSFEAWKAYVRHHVRARCQRAYISENRKGTRKRITIKNAVPVYRCYSGPEVQLQPYWIQTTRRGQLHCQIHLPITPMSEKITMGRERMTLAMPWIFAQIIYLPLEDTSLLFPRTFRSPRGYLGHLDGQERAKLSGIPMET